MTTPVVDSLAVLARGSKSFAFAARFLPRARRLDAAQVYAFCRLVDDVADESPSDAEALAELDKIETELCQPDRSRPVVHAFVKTADRRGIDLDHARELLVGVRSDRGAVRVADDAELVRYAYRVAGAVGLLMCPILGVQDRRAWPFAIDLGIAMQLTNVCRDVLEDASLGRVYLPQARLDAAGIDAKDILRGTVDRQRLCRVVAGVLGLAEAYYRSAAQGLNYIPWRPRLAIAVASRVYRQIGARLLARHGGDALHGRTVVPGWQKPLVSMRALFALFSPVYWGAIRPPHDARLHYSLHGLPGADETPLVTAPGVA